MGRSLALAADPSPSKASKSTEKGNAHVNKENVYLLNVESNQVGAEFFVNDVPVLLIKESRSDSNAAFISVLITGPNNQLRCVLRPGATPLSALTSFKADRPQGKIVAKILKLPPDFKAGAPSGDTIAQMSWSTSQSAGGNQWPVIKEVAFEAQAPSSVPTWRRAEVLTLNEETSRSAVEWLRQLREWFESGNADAIIAVVSDSLKDEALANGKDPASHLSSFTHMLRGQGKIEGLAPIDPGVLNLRLVGGGRLIDCRRADWSPAIRTLPHAKNDFDYSVLMGRVDGQWRLF